MAKAKASPAVGAVPDVYEWSAGVLQLRFSEVLSFRGAALVPWNDAAVHDMRVALRRLRTALRDLAGVIDDRRVRRIRRDLRRLARRLGEVRDPDVALESLAVLEIEASDEAVCAGIREIADDIKAIRERAHGRFRAALASINLDELQERLREQTSAAVRQPGLFGPSGISTLGRSAIDKRLVELHSLGPAIYDPTNGPHLHELRIAVKRLRYTIELFAGGFNGEFDETLRELAKMQTLLGDVHDCEVWTASLAARIAAGKRGPPPDTKAAALWLIELFVKKRTKTYLAALALWNRWQSDSLEERIRRSIAAA